MGRTIHKLTAKQVAALTEPGYYGDGGNLYLQISRGGSKSWIIRYTFGGRKRDMGAGAVRDVPLAKAREKAAQVRSQVLDGIDPIAVKASQRAVDLPFSQYAEDYIAANASGWKNERQAEQWRNSLATYALPKIGRLAPHTITTEQVLGVLEPIWRTKNETASRVRGRIEQVIDYAKVKERRTGENPARWRGHLDKILPKPSKVKKVKHHTALPYSRMPEFFAALRTRQGGAARALQFTILTCARTSEVTGVRFSELDLDHLRWTIPAERMKAGRVHRVALSTAAAEIIRSMPRVAGTDLVFPNPQGEELSENGMMAVLDRMEYGDYTVHGFRSTFRDWAAEEGNYPAELAEMALAHAVSDKVEAAYRRGDMFKRRIELAEAWARFCLGLARTEAIAGDAPEKPHQ